MRSMVKEIESLNYVFGAKYIAVGKMANWLMVIRGGGSQGKDS